MNDIGSEVAIDGTSGVFFSGKGGGMWEIKRQGAARADAYNAPKATAGSVTVLGTTASRVVVLVDVEIPLWNDWRVSSRAWTSCAVLSLVVSLVVEGYQK